MPARTVRVRSAYGLLAAPAAGARARLRVSGQDGRSDGDRVLARFLTIRSAEVP